MALVGRCDAFGVRGVGFAVAAAALTACGGLNMERHYQNYRGKLLSENYDAAAKYVRSKKEDFYGEKNRLLYYMDQGMLLHLGERYQESNAYLERAKQTAEDLWTDSIGENAAAWLTTDNSISYQGEDFEKVMIHFVAALNYLSLGKYSAARVEARQITSKLELYNSKYETASVYRDDAFARWLAGKLRETEGGYQALNDAWIDYKKAIAIYERDYTQRYRTPVPTPLVADALRVLDGLGSEFAEEFAELRERYPDVDYVRHADARTRAQVVLIYLSGEAPYKVDKFWTAAVSKNEILRIAFPKFIAKPHRLRQARLTVNGATQTSVLAQDLTAIAIRNLDDHMARIRTKAIARAVAKYAAGKAAQAGGRALEKENKQAGQAVQLAGLLWNWSQALAEEADKRSWVTLPSRVSLAQVFVDPGRANVRVEAIDGRRVVGPPMMEQPALQAGATYFVIQRTFR